MVWQSFLLFRWRLFPERNFRINWFLINPDALFILTQVDNVWLSMEWGSFDPEILAGLLWWRSKIFTNSIPDNALICGYVFVPCHFVGSRNLKDIRIVLVYLFYYILHFINDCLKAQNVYDVSVYFHETSNKQNFRADLIFSRRTRGFIHSNGDSSTDVFIIIYCIQTELCWRPWSISV